MRKKELTSGDVINLKKSRSFQISIVEKCPVCGKKVGDPAPTSSYIIYNEVSEERLCSDCIKYIKIAIKRIKEEI